MSDQLGKLFFFLYPAKPKHVHTPQGRMLRTMLGICMILHICFFVASLVAIGFLPMIVEIGFALWTFSCYLTLREWEVIGYILSNHPLSS